MRARRQESPKRDGIDNGLALHCLAVVARAGAGVRVLSLVLLFPNLVQRNHLRDTRQRGELHRADLEARKCVPSHVSTIGAGQKLDILAEIRVVQTDKLEGLQSDDGADDDLALQSGHVVERVLVPYNEDRMREQG